MRKSNDYAAYALDDYGDTNESCKWHEHEKELKDFSKTKPNLIFKLDGNGQKNGDIWTKYFKGGKMQVCKAVISVDGFNETLLK